ncbi:MAG: hypothetical protein KGL42_08170, partial [Betaproteobacteria bacterium]|nr:hypothetical protein [Betaproteobacteria bacterium]
VFCLVLRRVLMGDCGGTTAKPEISFYLTVAPRSLQQGRLLKGGVVAASVKGSKRALYLDIGLCGPV